MRFLRYVLGGLALLAGFATMLYGASIASSDSDVIALLVCLVALAVMGLGAWLCGAEIDWRNYD